MFAHPSFRAFAVAATLASALPAAHAAAGDVDDLEVYEGDLIAAGPFYTAGGRTLHRIARWNGSEWRGLDGGADASVLGLTTYQNDLIALWPRE